MKAVTYGLIFMMVIGIVVFGLMAGSEMNTSSLDLPATKYQGDFYKVIYKEYNVTSKTLTIRNETDVLGLVTLLTPLNNHVSAGTDVMVAKLQFDIRRNVNNFVNVVETLNVKDKMKAIDKNLTFKYLRLQNITVNDFNYVCNTVTLGNSSQWNNCSYNLNGTKVVRYENWTKINWNQNIPANVYTVGIFTDVDFDESSNVTT